MSPAIEVGFVHIPVVNSRWQHWGSRSSRIASNHVLHLHRFKVEMRGSRKQDIACVTFSRSVVLAFIFDLLDPSSHRQCFNHLGDLGYVDIKRKLAHCLNIKATTRCSPVPQSKKLLYQHFQPSFLLMTVNMFSPSPVEHVTLAHGSCGNPQLSQDSHRTWGFFQHFLRTILELP
jgi:hypothetical protein